MEKRHLFFLSYANEAISCFLFDIICRRSGNIKGFEWSVSCKKWTKWCLYKVFHLSPPIFPCVFTNTGYPRIYHKLPPRSIRIRTQDKNLCSFRRCIWYSNSLDPTGCRFQIRSRICNTRRSRSRSPPRSESKTPAATPPAWACRRDSSSGGSHAHNLGHRLESVKATARSRKPQRSTVDWLGSLCFGPPRGKLRREMLPPGRAG